MSGKPFHLLERVKWQSSKGMVVSLEGNDRNFEDRERTVVKLKSFFFNSLYHWTVALDYLNLLGFQYFLDIFYLSS
jgi:hypothetical protein